MNNIFIATTLLRLRTAGQISRKLWLILLLMPGVYAFAQEGNPFITNIVPGEGNRDFIWSVTQSSEEMMFFAGRNGLMYYDSESWNEISLDHLPLSIEYIPSHERVYVSGKNQIGYVQQNQLGNYVYTAVADSISGDQHFASIHNLHDTIYVLSQQEVIRILASPDSSEHIWRCEEQKGITGSFINNNHLYLTLKDKGLLRISGDTAMHLNTHDALNNQNIVFHVPYSNNRTLLGTTNGELLVFESENQIHNITVDDQEILRSGIITSGVGISDSLLAISTRNRGTLIINKYQGNTIHHLNTLSGLPADFHADLYKDHDQALWIAHPMGISRVDPMFPANEFTGYSGLEGNVLRTSYWNDQLYAATTFGLYVLDTLKRVDKEQITRRIPVQQSKDTEEEKEKDGLFSRLISSVFGKEEDEDPQKDSTAPSYRYINKEITKEYSAGYFYRNIEEINTKCKQLMPVTSGLLALTDTILYQVDHQHKASPVFTNTHIYEIIRSHYSRNKIYLITLQGLFVGEDQNGKWQFEKVIANTNDISVESFTEVDSDHYLFVSDHYLFYGSFNGNERSTYDTIWQLDNIYYNKPRLAKPHEDIYMISGNDLYHVHRAGKDSFNIEKSKHFKAEGIISTTTEHMWLQDKDNYINYFGENDISFYLPLLQVFDHINDIVLDQSGNLWIVNNQRQIYKLHAGKSADYTYQMPIAIKKIETLKGDYIDITNAEVGYSNNSLRFFVSSPFYLKVNTVQYSYMIEGLMDSWSEWSESNKISIPYLPPGKYEFQVKSRNIFGKESNTKSISFRVNTPFWRTSWFYLACFLLLAALVFIWQRMHVARLSRDQKILEEKVRVRTEEIENQKLKIENQNKAINDSITYASRIQRALLPSKKILEEYLHNHFVLFKPRESVSGDFYWAAKKDDDIIMVAADCTGHGVPGAFMSIMGIAYLNEVINKQKFNSTSDILNTLRSYIIELLEKNYTGKYPTDGMDISLLLLNREQGLVQFSGAYNSVYRVTDKKNIILPDMEPLIKTQNENHALLEYKVDRMSIGYSEKLDSPFTAQTVPYIKGDTYYLFSDGFPDQFGGERGKKFMYRRFREELLRINHLPMDEQHTKLDNTMKSWMNGYEQIDDILVLGIRI